MSWKDYGWLDQAAIISVCFAMAGMLIARIAIEFSPSAMTVAVVLGLWFLPALTWLICVWSIGAHDNLEDVCKVIGGLTFFGLFTDEPFGALFLGIALVPFSVALGLVHKPARGLLNIGRADWRKL